MYLDKNRSRLSLPMSCCPVIPQPNLSLRVDNVVASGKKASFIFQANAADGKLPHLFFALI